MADPSAAAARLQVLGMSCDLTGSLPATRLHSDRSGFDRLDCTGTECCLTDDAPHALLEATKFNAGFTCMRVYHDPPSWSRPMRVCLRSEAPWHAAEEASSPCVPPATMRLLGIAHLARDRLPRPEASTRPSSLRPRGWFGSVDWNRGREAHRFHTHEVACACRRVLERRFCACHKDVQRVVQRRAMSTPGP